MLEPDAVLTAVHHRCITHSTLVDSHARLAQRSARRFGVSARAARTHSARLEEFDRVIGRVFEKNLLSAPTRDDLVAKACPRLRRASTSLARSSTSSWIANAHGTHRVNLGSRRQMAIRKIFVPLSNIDNWRDLRCDRCAVKWRPTQTHGREHHGRAPDFFSETPSDGPAAAVCGSVVSRSRRCTRFRSAARAQRGRSRRRSFARGGRLSPVPLQSLS
jgi:hypothetical protein